MNINKWKSCAVDIDTYCIIRAMGQQGFRRPGSMIAKIVDDEIKKIAKRAKSYLMVSRPADWMVNLESGVGKGLGD